MLNLLIIAQESKTLEELHASLVQNGFACSVISYNEGVAEMVARQSPDLVLVEMDGHLPASRIWGLSRGIKRERQLPIIALITREMLDNDFGKKTFRGLRGCPYT